MTDYIIYTDSACDLGPARLAEWGVRSCALSFKFDDSEKIYSNDEMDVKTFYQRMRKGGVAKTSAINAETFSEAFEKALQEGKDILYLGFSSGLSATYNAARIAAAELQAKYPDHKLITVDTLSAAVGQGMLVRMAVDKKEAGATIEETAAYIEGIRTKICHWVTVEDLVYLKRGGRISPTLAFVGNALGLKPMLCVDENGKLESASKARGRKKAMAQLLSLYGEYAEDPSHGLVYIAHADCAEDARELAGRVETTYGVSVGLIGDIGPVIGAHAGPGTLVICFVGKER